MSDLLKHVHVTTLQVEPLELTPEHDPREDTPTYRKAHHYLVVETDHPCEVCGVRQSTIGDPLCNPYRATAMHTHHFPVERSLANACDYKKIHRIAPTVVDGETLLAWVDSPGNLRVLCNIHHLSNKLGIHHLLSQDFAVLPFLKDGYIVVSDDENKAADLAADQKVEDSHEPA